MSYNVKENTITVDGNVYRVERTPDRGHPEETLTIKDFDVVTDDWVFPFEGLEATIGYEDDTEHANPRQWDNVGVINVTYRGYTLGDEDISEIDFQRDCDNCDGTGEEPINQFEKPKQTPPMIMPEPETCKKCQGNGWYEVNPVEYFKKERGARVVLPVIVYEHSGITMKVGRVGDIMGDAAGWDTSFVGFTFDDPEMVKKCMGDDVTDEQIEEALRQEMMTYASYLEGDVRYFSVQDEETNFYESCYGFVGDDDNHVYDQCFEALERAVETRLNEIKERAHWAARDTETR
jgi:hypothetical protein